jgi:heme/copper-type cytochrome/quinol oxidase subunit 1
MSLENPTKIEKMIEALKTFNHWRIVGALAGILIVVGFVLFTVDACGDWSENRKREKLKANVNAALTNIATREKAIANLKERQAIEVEAVNRHTREYIDAQNYTDSTRSEVNKALANMANAAKANGNVSVKELEEKLRGL